MGSFIIRRVAQSLIIVVLIAVTVFLVLRLSAGDPARIRAPVFARPDVIEQYRRDFGIDRPLVRKADFATWLGHLVKMETSVLVDDRKRFKGKIAEAGADDVLIERDKAAYGEQPSVRVPYDAISEARLILTDDLIRDALSKDNRARKEAKKRRGDAVEDGDAEDGNEAED